VGSCERVEDGHRQAPQKNTSSQEMTIQNANVVARYGILSAEKSKDSWRRK